MAEFDIVDLTNTEQPDVLTVLKALTDVVGELSDTVKRLKDETVNEVARLNQRLDFAKVPLPEPVSRTWKCDWPERVEAIELTEMNKLALEASTDPGLDWAKELLAEYKPEMGNAFLCRKDDRASGETMTFIRDARAFRGYFEPTFKSAFNRAY